ncbi:MAG: VOC family protein [Aliidongia sp.]
MKYLHTMVRVTDVEASLDFYVNKLGLTNCAGSTIRPGASPDLPGSTRRRGRPGRADP